MNKQYLVTGIIIAVIGGGAFYGGTVFEKQQLSAQGLLRGGNNGGFARGDNSQTGPGGGPNGQRQSGRQGGFAGARGGANGDFVTGQVLSKDEKSLTIKTSDGGSRIVFFSDTTTVGKSIQGAVGDLATGDQVMVNGKANTDGTLSAQNIQIRPTPPQTQQ